MSEPDPLPPPPLALLLGEARVLLAWPAFHLRTLSVAKLPHGDGHAVLVLPGFGTTNAATHALRHALAKLEYRVYGWPCGRNLGMRPRVRDALDTQLQRLYMRYGAVSLIGWSLGGIFARELARHHPERVRNVITLGSPFSGHPAANNLRGLLRLANGGHEPEIDWARFRRHEQPPPVPCFALYTRGDGIVNWRCCLEPAAANTRNIEVSGSHLSLVLSMEVLRITAGLLARPTLPTLAPLTAG